jgi:hypothetical protein
VVKSGPSHVGHVNEEVVINLAGEAVVLQPNTGICVTVVFDDIIWCPETLSCGNPLLAGLRTARTRDRGLGLTLE